QRGIRGVSSDEPDKRFGWFRYEVDVEGHTWASEFRFAKTIDDSYRDLLSETDPIGIGLGWKQEDEKPPLTSEESHLLRMFLSRMRRIPAGVPRQETQRREVLLTVQPAPKGGYR